MSADEDFLSAQDELSRELNAQNNFEENLDKLTPREREVLDNLASGKSYKMIADEMDISPNTVPSFIKRLYEKLEVHSATEAISKAFLKKK